MSSAETGQTPPAGIERYVVPDSDLGALEANVMEQAGAEHLIVSPNTWLPNPDSPESTKILLGLARMVGGILSENDSQHENVDIFVVGNAEKDIEGMIVASDILGYDELESARERLVAEANEFLEALDSPYRL